MVTAWSRVTVLLMVTLVLAGSASPPPWKPFRLPRPPAEASTGPVLDAMAVSASPEAPPVTAPPVPAALTPDGLALRSAPVAVPLMLRIPTLGVDVGVLGVGMTSSDAMDAPVGKADDPVWQQAFWYRGSAVPGAPSTALIAGHIDDSLGRPAVFNHIDSLEPGDPIVAHDTRTGLDVRFAVTESTEYPLDETTRPDVLARIYGTGPVVGAEPQPSADGLAHLTLITCAGTFRNGTHDHRRVVFATRVT